MSRIAAHDLYYLGVIGLVRLNDLFHSPAITRALVRTLGLLAFVLSLHKKRQIRKNLYVTFGRDCEQAKINRIVHGTFTDFWREMLSWSTEEETGLLPGAPEISGLAHLQTALENGKGVILWDSNGFGRRLLAKKILFREGFGVIQVHGPNNLGGFLTNSSRASRVRRNRVKPFFDRREQGFVAAQIDLPASDSMVHTRTMRDSLTRNGILCAAGDGRVGQKQISICFLNHQTPFSTGLVSMARMTGAVILPMFCYQEQDRVRLNIDPPLVIPEGPERDAAQRAVLEAYAARLEAHIREFPEQYRNWHLVATP